MRHGIVASLVAGVLAGASTAQAAPTAGPVPGAADLTITVAADGAHCGGVRYRVKKIRGARSDADFVAAMTVAFPSGLDLAAKDPTRNKAAMKKFTAWFEDAMKRMTVARSHFEKIAFASPPPAPADKVIAVARIAQLERHFADVIGTAEIPRSLLSHEFAKDAISAYCGTLDQTAAPLAAKADEAAAACAKFAADAHVGPGWWDAVCVAPPPPAAP
ncbi:MAG: hypothetical protein K8W52_08195 [Deltaproteobacteria bacterium]|nr:hypothetical protein [Deltaproteobacteria bacterium]